MPLTPRNLAVAAVAARPAPLAYPGTLLATFRSRSFRWLLLALVALPALLAYWQAAVWGPIHLGFRYPTDGSVYLGAALDLLHGRDPYSGFWHETARGIDPALQGSYIYPPLWAWILQPLTAAPWFAQRLVLLAFDQACLFASLWLCLRTLGVRDRQRAFAYLLLVLLFMPDWENALLLQVNPLIGLFTAAWAYAWVEQRRWGGVPLGLGIALKPMQVPLLLLPALRRHRRELALATAALVVPSLLAVPRYLPEYLLRVLPLLSSGSPNLLNQSPSALVTRLVHPASIYIPHYRPVPAAKYAGVAVALAALALAAWALRRPAADREQRRSEVSLLIAAGPLFSTLVWAPHTALLLLPLVFLFEQSLRLRRWLPAAGAALFYAAMGPARLVLVNALWDHTQSPEVQRAMSQDAVQGGWDIAFRIWALAGPVALVALFLAALWVHLRLQSGMIARDGGQVQGRTGET